MREDGHSIPIQDIRIIHKMGDCTNFVSQALRAGGLRDIHGRRDWAQYWFFNNKNDLSMSWSNAHSFARHVRENPDRYTITNDLSTLTP